MTRDVFDARNFREESPFKIHGGCGLFGVIDRAGKRWPGQDVIDAMACMDERSNGLGAGYAVYGLYPEHPNHYAFHLMYNDEGARATCEEYLRVRFEVDHAEAIPTRAVTGITDAPLLHRYFCSFREDDLANGEDADDLVVTAVMHINSEIDGAYVFSSGRNMAAFKAKGFPREVGEFYRLDEYEASCWIGHGRFPTNTPGWWGGAHPFCILDFSIVHNGEITSYGINKRYLEMHGYLCTLGTDTEVVAYIYDLLLRRHGLPLELACKVVAPPFWSDIARMPPEGAALMTALRRTYGPAAANGPFAIVLGFSDGFCALNDRIKLRPLTAAEHGDKVFVSSEESAIRAICPDPDRSWHPEAGEPVIARYYGANGGVGQDSRNGAPDGEGLTAGEEVST